MDSRIIIVLIMVVTFMGCASQDRKHTASFKLDTNELQAYNEIDFELIKAWVNGKRIVAIGESTHGLGEFFSMKSEIVQFLHKDLGYEVLAMEGGFADINLAWIDVDQLSPLELRNRTLYGNFICQEVEPLFEYIKENAQTERPLLYAGFDTQSSGNYYKHYLDAIATHLDLGIDINEAFSSYTQMYQASFETDSTNFIKHKAHYQNTLATIRDEISENKKYLQRTMALSDKKLQLIQRNLELQYKAVDYDYSNKLNKENMHQGIVLRDQIMAQNIEWVIETLYPDKKVIIWAHNGHIGKSGINNYSTKMMGEYLQDVFQKDYFSIGLFAYQGNTYQHWTGQSLTFENSDSTAIEYKMKREGYLFTYQKFGNNNPKDWTNQEVTALEIENGGNVSFIPSKRFDAAITIFSGDVPRFNNRK